MNKLIFVLLFFSVFSQARAQQRQFKIVAKKSFVNFSVRYMKLTDVPGDFKNFSGSFLYNSKVGNIEKLKVQIDVATIDTKDESRDRNLRGSDYFSTEKFPKITFVAKKIVYDERKVPKSILGRLKIKDKEGDFTFKVDSFKQSSKTAVLAQISAVLNRKNWGLSWNRLLDQGGMVISDDVKIKASFLATALAESKSL